MALPAGTITAANSIFFLSIAGLLPVPQQLQGYSADAAFETDASEPTEVVIGVDGRMSAGYTPFLTTQTITLQADSPSVLLFESWVQTQKATNEVYYANGIITLPSVNRAYVLTNGVLNRIVPIPGTRKVLQPRAFTIIWGSIDPAPI